MKKSLCLFMILLMMAMVPNFAFAEEDLSLQDESTIKNPLVLDFRYYSYTLNNVPEDEVNVVKTIDNEATIEYEIYDRNDSKVVDVIRVDFPKEEVRTKTKSSKDIRSTFFSKYKTIKNGKKKVVELVYKVRVDFYESGSFRAFYGADTPNLLIASAITSMELVNVEKSVKSTTGKFPTDSLTYGYSANLRTTTSITSTVSGDLVGAGFSVGTDTKKHYYRIVQDTGTIDLY